MSIGLRQHGGQRVHKVFARQAERTPEATALIVGAERLSYAELDRRSDRLAASLRARGAGAGNLVGVCLPRNSWLVPALLGVLKAGAAYVPLDPLYPADRLRLIAEDAELSLIVHDAATAKDAARTGASGIDVDDLPEEGGDEHGEGDLAYVLYTSGSTGRPKGVAIAHRNAMAFLDWATTWYGADELRGSLAGASVCFDFSILEIFAPLLTGGTVILADSVFALAALAARDEVTMVCGPPSALAVLLDRPLPGGVRTVNFGGETLTSVLCERAYANPGVRRVVNLYGPTEITTACLAHDVGRGDPSDPGDPLLGHPIAGAELSVRDRDGVSVAEGDVGELWVAGPGVSAGYLRRSELTAERFVDDPAVRGGRRYRTGDLVRHTTSGYQFVGRLDDQVKVRGFRVEPAEVQAVLASAPSVRSCAVLAPVDPYGTRRLVGYVEPGDVEPGNPVTERELMGYLRERLPAFMVPSRIAVLDRLPLSPTGKVDRAALPPVDFAHAYDDAYVAPIGETETALAMIIAEVLGVAQVGRHERFTELGGHSLAAARVVAVAGERLGVSAPLAAFLAGPTVAELAQALRERGEDSSALRPHRSPRGPLTDIQRQFWTLRQVSATPWVTTVGFRLRVCGLPDAETLAAALSAVVARHETLRTRVEEHDGHLEAVVGPPAPVSVTVEDLRGVPAAQRLERARAFATQSFDLAADTPLLRAALLWTAEDASATDGTAKDVSATDATAEVVIAVDHIAFDGVSIGVLMAELAAGVAAARAGTDVLAAVTPPPAQVGDVALAKASACQAAADATQSFWRSTLDGVEPPYDLPSRTRTGAAGQAHAGARVIRPIDVELMARVDAVAKRHGVTAYAVWAAALAVLVDGLTGRADTLLGVAAADRDRPGLDRVIGALLDVLPVRVDCGDDPPFVVLAARVRDATHAALAHRDIPAAELARLATAERPPGASLTPVVLSVQPPDLPVEVSIGDTRVQLLGELDTAASQNDLTVYVNVTVAGPELHLEYATYRFGSDDAVAVADRLLHLVSAAVGDPGRRVSALALVPDAEKEWLLAAGDGGPVPDDVPDTIVHAILKRAREAPDAVAVVGPAATLTYAELVAHGERIAGALARHGAGRGVAVGICLPRDHLLPATLFGVLRAGSAYLPLEPDLPPDRISYLATDGGVEVVLVTPATAGVVAHLDGVTVLDAATLSTPDTQLPQLPDPGGLAYVLYTSGSTGRPKGVEVSHANLAAYVATARRLPGYGPDDVFLAVAPLSFDLSCFELWVALSIGARSVVVGRDVAVDGPALAARIERMGVTAMLVTPATLRLLLAGGMRPRRELTVISAGEPLDAALAGEVQAVAGRLFNGYGPTEATVTVTAYPVPAGITDPIPIGGPTPGDRLYVLDRLGRLAPAGAVGELWIGGAGVARGYRGRAELTARAFTDDPYLPGGRRYRTGDLVRWRPDGTLEYLGRRDAQVKLRGYRIELTEIEAALHEHPAVADAAVALVGPGTLAGPAAARAGSPDAYLAGYLVGSGGVDTADIEAHARRRLPPYMVPQRWLVLDALPRTRSGKLDRRALPVPEVKGGAASAPQTETEKFIAEIWAEVLGRTDIGGTDDFFALGGHSLAATRVVTRLRDQLGCDINVQMLFDHPRLSGFAAEVERHLLADLADIGPADEVWP